RCLSEGSIPRPGRQSSDAFPRRARVSGAPRPLRRVSGGRRWEFAVERPTWVASAPAASRARPDTTLAHSPAAAFSGESRDFLGNRREARATVTAVHSNEPVTPASEAKSLPQPAEAMASVLEDLLRSIGRTETSGALASEVCEVLVRGLGLDGALLRLRDAD